MKFHKLIPKKQLEISKITWNASILSYLDLHTNQCELKVKKIIYRQKIKNQLSKAFTEAKKVIVICNVFEFTPIIELKKLPIHCLLVGSVIKIRSNR